MFIFSLIEYNCFLPSKPAFIHMHAAEAAPDV